MSDWRRARVKVLDAGEPCFEGQVSRRESARAEVVGDTALRPGSLVEVECEDALLLGEVSACRAQGEGYAMDLRIEHAVRWTREVAELARAIREA